MNGEKTLIILPTVGDYSPVLQYKALADSLSKNYRVVIVEPLGYGYSLSSKLERSSKNIVNEIREALRLSGINGPYTLLSFSTSSLYAEYYSKEFPEEIAGLITIDAVYSESLESEKFRDEYLPNLISNVKFYSVASFSGLFRWESYIFPENYCIDKMKENNSYKDEEIKLFRNRIANKYFTSEMIKEVEKMKDNMNELSDYKFDENLSTLQIITVPYRDQLLDRQENISKYATNLVTNNTMQKIRTIEGSIEDYLYTKDGIKELSNLINMYF